MDDAPKTVGPSKQAIELIAVILACATFAYIATAIHLVLVDRPAAKDIYNWHTNVLAGTASSPNQYRPGAYLLAEGLKNAFSGDIYSAYFYERLFFTFTTGLFSFLFFRRFLPFGWSLAALCWFYAILPQTYIGYGHQPADPINATFFALAYLTVASNAPLWVIPLTGIGAFFRETSILMPLFSLMITYDKHPRWHSLVQFAGGVAAGMIVYGLTRGYYGPAEHPDPWIMIGVNLKSLVWIRFFLTATLAPVVLSIWCWKGLDSYLKRSLIFVLLFLIIHFIFARFGETRLMLPILPLLICSALAGLKWKLGE